MDIPLCLDYLTQLGRLQSGEDWGPCANTSDLYPDFAAGWRGTSAVPTLQEMDAAWAAIQAAGGVAEIEAKAARATAKDRYDALSSDVRRLRAVVVVLLGEINALRQRDRDRAADVAAAASLAALKVAWAARPELADRTAAQARTAIRSAIDGDEPA